MSAMRARPAAPPAVARFPRPAAPAPAPRQTDDLAAAAQAAGGAVSSGQDFLEISFPPPAGAPNRGIARAPAPAASASPPAIARTPANPPRALGGGGAVLARATGGGSGGDLSLTDNVVEAVLRAMREENEHLGILDGIDPLF
jgi:hypothetical protein